MMIGVEITDDQETLWTVALVIGAVVLLAVVALMSFLYLVLRDIRTGVMALGGMAERMREELTAGDLPATAAAMQELREELRLHEEALSRR